MPHPPDAKTVFVAWDHSVDEHQAELPVLIRGAGTRHAYTARCAGGDDPDGPISEDLCRDIRGTDCLLAFFGARQERRLLPSRDRCLHHPPRG